MIRRTDGPRLMNQMGRGGLRVTVSAGNRDVRILTAHLKSKLLTFPGGFAPANEDQRARLGLAGNEFRRATGDLELTRLFMRHASISTTSEHYMHADKTELIAGMRRLEERWEKE